MDLKGIRIGIAMTGSFCTMEKVFAQMELLVQSGALVTTIFSYHGSKLNNRFGTSSQFLNRAYKITETPSILTIPEAEAVGPGKLFDVLLVAPCTGNTLAKLANGITDTPALMAAKAHLRNERPLVLAPASNDFLGLNLKNIGLLLNVKDVYFVPFGQDDPQKKPASMVFYPRLIRPALEAALESRQYQPVLISPFVKAGA